MSIYMFVGCCWPSLSLTFILKQSVTPWSFRPSIISSLVACRKSGHFMTPFDEFSVRWSAALTGTPAKSDNFRSLLLCEALSHSMSM